MEELGPALLCRIVLIQPHWSVSRHELPVQGHAKASQSDSSQNFDVATQGIHLVSFETFRGGLACVLQIIVLLHNPTVLEL